MGKTENEPPLVVCDAGPLIHLDELGALELLTDFSAVLVPEAVWIEVAKHRPSALSHPRVSLQRIAPQKKSSAGIGCTERDIQLTHRRMGGPARCTRISVESPFNG